MPLIVGHHWVSGRLFLPISSESIPMFSELYVPITGNPSPLSFPVPMADTDATKIFLQECSEHFKDYRIIMVMDGPAWHRSRDIGEYNNIRTIHQPFYSLELNPVEHPWERIRKNYRRHCMWSTMEALDQALECILKTIMECAETIRSIVIVRFHRAII